MTFDPAGMPPVLLPDYPTLLTGIHVLERGPDQVQVGLDPPHGVVITGLPAALVERIRRLDGAVAAEQILLAESEHPEQLRTVLRQLTALGLVVDAGPPGASRRRRCDAGFWSLRARHHQTALADRRREAVIAIEGNGRIATAVALLLANAGIGHIDLRMSDAVTEQDLGSGFTDADVGTPRRRALADLIHRVDPAIRTSRVHGLTPELVLLTDTIVPAPELVADLVSDGVTHMPVRVRDGTGLVGPLVVPGRTSCLHCADLHCTDADPCWPRVSLQLVGRPERPDLGAAQACASLAVAQAMRMFSPNASAPPTWNTILEIDAYEGRIRHRSLPPHPLCPCGAGRALQEA